MFLVLIDIHAKANDSSLISNPGFEEFYDDWDLMLDNDQVNIEIVDIAYSGSNAMQVTSALGNDSDWELLATIKDADKLAVTPGDMLYYSVMVKADSIQGEISKSFITYNANGELVNRNAGVMEITLETDQYVQYVNKFIVPEGISFVIPRITGKGGCDITIDDFVLNGEFFVSFSAKGSGSVISQDGYYEYGSKIKIEALPDAANQFVAWGGDYYSDINPDSVMVTGDMDIVARFVAESTVLSHKFYVSTKGSDVNNGSVENPWASIEYGSNQLYPGDTLIVKAGTYSNFTTITNSGGNGKYITILGEGEVTIENSSPSNEGVLNVVDAKYVIVDGITIKNAKAHGIKILGRCSYVVIRNCKTIHTDGCGILVQGSRAYHWDGKYYASNIIIENNEVHWPQEGVWNGHLLWHEDITLMYGIEHFEVRNNYVNAYDTINYDGGPIGIDVKSGVRYGSVHHNTVENIPCTGLYVDASGSYVRHIDVYSNFVNHTMAYGIQIGAERGGPIDSVWVFNNVIVKPKWCGIVSGDFTRGDEPPLPQAKTHIDIFNNTIYEVGPGWGFGILTESSFKQGKIYNNIIFDTEKDGMSLNMVDGNLVTNNCINRIGGDFGDNIIVQNPLFVDPTNGDFTLLINSPCIDAGTSTAAPSSDFDGNARPFGLGYDIGAYEAQYKVELGFNKEYLSERKLQAYPNPFSDFTTINYSVEKYSNVVLSVYDIYGKQIEILVNKAHEKGDYSIDWKGYNYIDGIYFYRLNIDGKSFSEKMILKK